MKYSLWTRKCTQITSDQLSDAIGDVTQEVWGARFQLRTMRQAQGAMSDRLGLAQLNSSFSRVVNAHHNAMGHSAFTGTTEYAREDKLVPCHEDEMELQKNMCDVIHHLQWGLDVPRLQDEPVNKPVNDVQPSLAEIQQVIINSNKALEQSITRKVETLLSTWSASHAHSYPRTLPEDSSSQDEQSQGDRMEEVDRDEPIELVWDDGEWDVGSMDEVVGDTDCSSDYSDSGELHYIPVFNYHY